MIKLKKVNAFPADPNSSRFEHYDREKDLHLVINERGIAIRIGDKLCQLHADVPPPTIKTIKTKSKKVKTKGMIEVESIESDSGHLIAPGDAQGFADAVLERLASPRKPGQARAFAQGFAWPLFGEHLARELNLG